MKNLVLAITTFNRKDYLKSCVESFMATRNSSYLWTLVIADDGSTDGTLEFINELEYADTEIIVIANNRIGVHQQMNSILSTLENIDYDFCFKSDDDITFFKSGWDDLYYKTAIESGCHHLVFCDQNWCSEQLLDTKVKSQNLIGAVPMLHAHGFFYTFTPQVVEKVGFMDVDTFGYRGMGHVDYTMRCARAGFTNIDTPWDVINSNSYISATKQNYHSVIPNGTTSVYDAFNRDRKEKIILQKNRIYVKNQEIDSALYSKFKDELVLALSNKVIHFEKEKEELISWYETEIKKISSWYLSQYKHLPKWYLKLGKLFKLIKLKDESK
jgi:glycosyltransferase involved in cell wall biosynthesis